MTCSQTNISGFRQRAIRISRNDNLFQCRIQAFRQSGQLDNLTRLARIGYQEQQVVFLQDTQIAMLRFAGMKENRRRPRRTKGSGDVHGYLSGFTHATGDQLSLFVVHLLYNQGDSLFVCVRYRNIEHGLRFAAQQFMNSIHFFYESFTVNN